MYLYPIIHFNIDGHLRKKPLHENRVKVIYQYKKTAAIATTDIIILDMIPVMIISDLLIHLLS